MGTGRPEDSHLGFGWPRKGREVVAEEEDRRGVCASRQVSAPSGSAQIVACLSNPAVRGEAPEPGRLVHVAPEPAPALRVELAKGILRLRIARIRRLAPQASGLRLVAPQAAAAGHEEGAEARLPCREALVRRQQANARSLPVVSSEPPSPLSCMTSRLV